MSKIGFAQPPAPSEAEIRERRIAAARRASAWTEIDGTQLVRRGRRFLVHSESDAVFVPYRGHLFNALGGLEHGDQAPLYFHIDTDGDLHVLEKQSGTWSSRVYAQGRAAADATRAEPRRRRVRR